MASIHPWMTLYIRKSSKSYDDEKSDVAGVPLQKRTKTKSGWSKKPHACFGEVSGIHYPSECLTTQIVPSVTDVDKWLKRKGYRRVPTDVA